jgi:hypothetical protein
MIRRALTCREVVELATEYFEASLPPEQSERFSAHVADCEGCQTHLRQLRITVELVRTVASREPVDPGTLMDEFRQWITGDADV